MMNSKESSKLLESWFRFWAEAVGSPQSSLESWQNINQLSSQSAAFQQWVAQFWPGVDAGTARSATQALEQWTQEWQRVMGVVPRSRYLELLEENDNLRHRLRQAEEQIARLETRKGETAVPGEIAQKTSAMWQNFFTEMAATQADWLKSWQTSVTEKPDSESE